MKNIRELSSRGSMHGIDAWDRRAWASSARDRRASGIDALGLIPGLVVSP